MAIRILFVDDKKTQFDLLNTVFGMCADLELVNEEPMFDESSQNVLDREEQKQQIIGLLKSAEYDIVLFDLSLRNGKEEKFRVGEAKNFLSIEIYNEMREWLSAENKKFVFVTGHGAWKEEKKFWDIGDAVEGSYYMRKPNDVLESRIACGLYDRNGETKCGEKFQYCKKGDCFNKVLRRIAKDG